MSDDPAAPILPKMDELARAENARSAPASTLGANVIEAWEVQRVDHDNGQIVYEVWSVKPYAFLFGIHEDLTPSAKAIAESIVRDHNRAPATIPAPPPQDNAHVAPGCQPFPASSRRQFGEPGECAYCERERAKQKDGVIPFFPPHDASSRCESGKHNHCTCDTCF